MTHVFFYSTRAHGGRLQNKLGWFCACVQSCTQNPLDFTTPKMYVHLADANWTLSPIYSIYQIYQILLNRIRGKWIFLPLEHFLHSCKKSLLKLHDEPTQCLHRSLKMTWTLINPLSPSINIQILQTDLHTFPQRISWENLIIDQGIFSSVIISFILITYLLTMYGYC